MNVARHLLGVAYETLPARVRRLHDRGGHFVGYATIGGASNLLAKLLRRVSGLPSPASGPLSFELERAGEMETWTRRFGSHVMRSTIGADGGLLREQLGLATFCFELRVEDGEIRWIPRTVAALGIPLPVRWFGGVSARELEAHGKYRFEVIARMPGAGIVVHYAGALDVD